MTKCFTRSSLSRERGKQETDSDSSEHPAVPCGKPCEETPIRIEIQRDVGCCLSQSWDETVGGAREGGGKRM